MGMAIGSSTGSGHKYIQIRNPFSGEVIGTIHVSKSSASKAKYATKKRKLNYNFKALSGKILRAKTSMGARQAVSAARRQVAQLSRNLDNDNYDQEELKSAILHAKRMERVARKKMKHLAQEEAMAERDVRLPENTEMEDMDVEGLDLEALMEMSEEEMKALLEELERTMKEIEAGKNQEELPTELEMAADAPERANEEIESTMDLRNLRRKHRSDEMREITDADMKYLKSLFDRLEREKAEAASLRAAAGFSQGSGNPIGQGYEGLQASPTGVTLELAGAPVNASPAPIPADIVGGSVDVAL